MNLRSFLYFVRRANDLTQKNDGVRGKANEVEKQLLDRVLEACCEEQMVMLSRQEERAMEEEKEKTKKKCAKGPGGWMWKMKRMSRKERSAETWEVAYSWRACQKTKQDP